MANKNKYDAIVVGGGHNGLVNGAYLAKSGLRVLILERRHLVGGAAITEELRPGFWFTTFSYALSLLRPEIIHELELTKHGFMPLLMPSTFAPMENGDYLLLGEDHAQNVQEIRRHSRHDADAYDRYHHDLDLVRRDRHHRVLRGDSRRIVRRRRDHLDRGQAARHRRAVDGGADRRRSPGRRARIHGLIAAVALVRGRAERALARPARRREPHDEPAFRQVVALGVPGDQRRGHRRADLDLVGRQRHDRLLG